MRSASSTLLALRGCCAPKQFAQFSALEEGGRSCYAAPLIQQRTLDPCMRRAESGSCNYSISGLYRDNGKENGNYRDCRGYIGLVG